MPTPGFFEQRRPSLASRLHYAWLSISLVASLGLWLMAGVSYVFSGCARYGSAHEQTIENQFHCRISVVEGRTTPNYWFWDRPSKAWMKDKTCPVEFVPVDSGSPDLLGEALGPLGGLSQHLVVPIK